MSGGAIGRKRSKAREGGVVASNPRRLRDEASSHIFILPPKKGLIILQATDVFSHTTLGVSRSYQGMSGDHEATTARSATPADIDRGVVTIAIGFAPLRPAEFVMLTIAQRTAASRSN
jgi:hypothetical protein